MTQGSFPRSRVAELVSPLTALALVASIVVVQCLPQLPPCWLDALLGASAVTMMVIVPRLRPLAWCLLGFAWAAWRADVALGQRLPGDWEGQDIDVVGRMVDLPHALDGSQRFDFRVDQAARDGQAEAWSGTVRVSWYAPTPALAPCESWSLRLRLKRPRGLINPGGFDFERHALEQGIVATGYVRDDGANARREPVPWCVDGLRAKISQGIATTLGDSTSTRLLRALAVGDQRDLDDADWQVLRATGVGHLIAISGLHVALLAGLGVLLMRGLWKAFPRMGLRVPGPLLEAPVGLLCATAYAALAGFGLPATRTLLMIAVIALARLARRGLAPAQGLALAALAMLMFDPLAVLSAGFWLSFVGVAFLILCLSGSPRAWWREGADAQGAMSVGLLPLSVWFFGQGSLVGPLANLIAVPFVSFLVVPLTLLGSALLLPLPTLAAPVLHLAQWLMQGQWWLLQKFAALPGAQWWLPEPAWWAFALALSGALWLLMPRGVPLRWAGALLFLPLLMPRLDAPREGEFDVTVIDVGQGLAVLVQTSSHAMVYDAGGRYPSGFDLGEAAVVPTAHALGVNRIDRLMISHGDNDHGGGAAAVSAALQPGAVQAGEPVRTGLASTLCQAGAQWRWDNVSFRVLGPIDPQAAKDNDRSCVLLIESAGARLLLTGDIGAEVEPGIAAAVGTGPAPVLVVPHHGSRTSSSAEFLATLNPSLALVSAGHRSRFGHPHPDVVRRYREQGIELVNTAEAGCLRLRLGTEAVPQWLERCRQARAAYWREQ